MRANIGAVILAAGRGSRFANSGGDGPKQLVSIDGLPMLQQVINQANTLLPGRVYSLLGSDWQAIEQQVVGSEVIINPHWQRGLGNSIACAVKHLSAAPAAYEGLLVMLGDQPVLNSSGLAEMPDLFDGDRAVCASYAGHAGVPALFPRALFANLIALDGDTGARVMLQSLTAKITVPMPEAAVDIDTVEDVNRLRQAAAQSGKFSG